MISGICGTTALPSALILCVLLGSTLTTRPTLGSGFHVSILLKLFPLRLDDCPTSSAPCRWVSLPHSRSLSVSETSSHLSADFSLVRRPLNPLRRMHLASPTSLVRSLGREDCLTFFSDPIDFPCMNPKFLLEGDPSC